MCVAPSRSTIAGVKPGSQPQEGGVGIKVRPDGDVGAGTRSGIESGDEGASRGAEGRVVCYYCCDGGEGREGRAGKEGNGVGVLDGGDEERGEVGV